MYGHGKAEAVGGRLFLVVVLGLALPVHPVQAGEDRIFADGFDPCCRIGGTVSGLTGSGLVLHLQTGATSEDHSISNNGLYAFAASVTPGTAYNVSIDTQPSGQSCTIANPSGSMGSSHADNVDVSCANGLRWDQGQWGEPWQ